MATRPGGWIRDGYVGARRVCACVWASVARARDGRFDYMMTTKDEKNWQLPSCSYKSPKGLPGFATCNSRWQSALPSCVSSQPLETAVGRRGMPCYFLSGKLPYLYSQSLTSMFRSPTSERIRMFPAPQAPQGNLTDLT